MAAGLAFVNQSNRLQDSFRSRLMFPIYDRAGTPVGFGGRSLTADGPKYKNTAETPLYHKSRLLYGLNWAKAEIGARDEVVICEGYTDVMGFALAGIPNSVATCGTALTEQHVQLLKSFTRKMVLAYDADSAGQSAAEQVVPVGAAVRHRGEGRRAATGPGSRRSLARRSRSRS